MGRAVRGERHRRRREVQRVHLLRQGPLQTRYHGQQGPCLNASSSG